MRQGQAKGDTLEGSDWAGVAPLLCALGCAVSVLFHGLS